MRNYFVTQWILLSVITGRAYWIHRTLYCYKDFFQYLRHFPYFITHLEFRSLRKLQNFLFLFLYSDGGFFIQRLEWNEYLSSFCLQFNIILSSLSSLSSLCHHCHSFVTIVVIFHHFAIILSSLSSFCHHCYNFVITLSSLYHHLVLALPSLGHHFVIIFHHFSSSCHHLSDCHNFVIIVITLS